MYILHYKQLCIYGIYICIIYNPNLKTSLIIITNETQLLSNHSNDDDDKDGNEPRGGVQMHSQWPSSAMIYDLNNRVRLHLVYTLLIQYQAFSKLFWAFNKIAK